MFASRALKNALYGRRAPRTSITNGGGIGGGSTVTTASTAAASAGGGTSGGNPELAPMSPPSRPALL